MKQIIYAAAITMASLACTHQQVDVLEETSPRFAGATRIEIRKSLSDVFINASSYCNSLLPVTPNCAEQTYAFQAQLMKLDPIPVPQPNLDPTISSDEAVQLYKQFITDHTGEPVLAVFRQLYPRILLNKYGVITSRDYPLVAYFARELIESGSYDFGTQANALTAIQPHVPAQQFRQLVQLAGKNLRLYKPVRQRSFDRQLAQLDNPDVILRRFPESMTKQMRTHLIERNKADNQAFAQLERLQSGIVN
ncbi:hypothetical protein [uncultured Fibrella sp.]|uniref:hypothetical protein n=1 Tax=uncultured Fibrella sp. TaxID=1284596 RepID=UPI0035C9D25A